MATSGSKPTSISTLTSSNKKTVTGTKKQETKMNIKDRFEFVRDKSFKELFFNYIHLISLNKFNYIFTQTYF